MVDAKNVYARIKPLEGLFAEDEAHDVMVSSGKTALLAHKKASITVSYAFCCMKV
jgi:hypothetical protein